MNGDRRKLETGPIGASRAALDVLLTDAARRAPAAPAVSSSRPRRPRPSSGLGRHPRRRRRPGGDARPASWRAVAAGRSSARPAQRRSSVRRSGVGGELAAAPDAAGYLAVAAHGRRADRRRRARLAHRAPGAVRRLQRARRARPDQLPVVQSGRPQRDDRPRRRQPRPRGPALRPRRLALTARLPATVDTSKFEVGGNLAAEPRARSSCAPTCSS